MPQDPLEPADPNSTPNSTPKNAGATPRSEEKLSLTIGAYRSDLSTESDDVADLVIGPYHLVQRIGEGGAGDVRQTHSVGPGER